MTFSSVDAYWETIQVGLTLYTVDEAKMCLAYTMIIAVLTRKEAPA
jgi:hypothetical protein